jgi:hypothetical protein
LAFVAASVVSGFCVFKKLRGSAIFCFAARYKLAYHSTCLTAFSAIFLDAAKAFHHAALI